MTPRFLVVLFTALLFVGAPAHAAGLCTDIAGMIRQGAAENAGPYGERSAIAHLAAKSGGRLRVIEGWKGDPPKRFTKGEDEDDEGERVELTPLGKSGVVAMTRTSGTMHCQHWSFFRDTGKRVTRLPMPAPLAVGDDHDLCWGEYAHVVTVHGTPALMIESDGKDHVGLSLTLWGGKRWGKTCSIAADFAPGFRMDSEYCKQAKGVCDALRAHALELVRLYRTDKGRLPPARKPDPAQKGTLQDLPTFGITSSNPYTRFQDHREMMVTVNGEPLLALVGEGSFGWRDYNGTLAAFWRVRDKVMEPVAGYQVDTYRGVATKVSTAP